MDEIKVQKGYRAVWLLVGAAVFFVIGFWIFNFTMLGDKPAPSWDLDDQPIVPASSIAADGYQPMPKEPSP